MFKDKKNLLAVGLLTLLAAATRLFHFGKPLAVVFDETYFLKFIGYYWDGTYFFDVHPPLGKLLFVLFAYVTGVTPTADIGTIGTSIASSLVLFRILPLVAGIVLPIVIYYICRHLSLTRLTSFAAGVFVCLENSLVVQSRFVLIDMILLLCGFLSLLFYLQYRSRLSHHLDGKLFLLASVISFAATISIKWTGLFFILPIIVIEIYDLFNSHTRRSSRIFRFIRHAAVYAVISTVIYMTVFAVHFSLLPKSGPGDVFMTPQFQKTLEGNAFAADETLLPPLFFGKFFELNVEMFEAHTRMTAPHDYSSKYYTWPLMTRPIYYWYQEVSSTTPLHSRIYLLGNPALYWGGIFAIVTMLLYLLLSLCTKNYRNIPHTKALFFILIGFVANFVPFIFIGRVMFLYHYQAALIFSIMGLAYLFELIPSRIHRLRVVLLCSMLCIIMFLYFMPLTYGTPLTPAQYESRAWFKSWK